jgi:predicted ATPase
VWIEEARIENYKCFHEPQTLRLERGFNVVIGRNNSGKSALLEALHFRGAGAPHRSKHSVHSVDGVHNQTTEIQMRIGITRAEALSWMSSREKKLSLRWPKGLPFSQEYVPAALDNVLKSDFLSLRFGVRLTETSRGLYCPKFPVIDSYPYAESVNGRAKIFSIKPKETKSGFDFIGCGETGEEQDSGLDLAEHAAKSIYRFDAQRLNIHRSSFGSSDTLAPNAANLPEVLNDMNNNAPEVFERYVSAVRRVFPDIRNIRTPAVRSSSDVQVRVWLEGTPKGRDDLGLSLEQCGTGIGQVLAILYVAVRSQVPRCLLIDEPSSFLHPDAARSLVSVLREYCHHQYIVSTHSPEVISACKQSPITRVRWEDGRSVIKQFDVLSSENVRIALSEVGAKLSDVFGFDQIIWVEGPSDAKCWELLLDAETQRGCRTAILPVGDTGAFRRKDLKRMLDLHRRLSLNDAWLPPGIAFLFDRDGRSDLEMEELSRESQGKIQFLSRRMIENYCLNLDAVTALLRSLDESAAIEIGQVVSWFGKRIGYDPNADEKWRESVHGAELVAELVSEFFDGRFEYRKIEHTPWLFSWVLKHRPDQLTELNDLLFSVGVGKSPLLEHAADRP